ncbi:MAG: hypothetical protein LBB90_05435, partial [Tannerella sp.]|nr:hypothetical protein [Tannerella sp.]
MKKVLSCICLVLAGCTAGERPATVYELDFIAPADLEAGFVSPPDYAKAGAFWMWLEGNISKEGILSDLTEMKKVGINNPTVFDASVCPGTTYGTLTERPAAGPVFMSPEWRELFVYTCRVADSLDMDISLNICSGWNSGGSWVTPEHAAKKIVWSEIVVEGPKQISEQLPLPKNLLADERTGQPFYMPVAVLAFKLENNSESVKPLENYHLKAVHSIHLPNTNNGLGYDWASLLKEEPSYEGDCHTYLENIVDLSDKTDADGRLSWDAPEGRYQIMRFGYTGTGIRVSSHSPGGGGLVIDYLKREAMKLYYDRTVKPVLEELKNENINNPKYLFEDSWELNAVNWTEGFEQHFKKVNGYDLLPYMPAIAGHVVESREASNKFLYDFRRTIADLIWENHYKYVKELAHDDGLGYHPESGGPHPAPIDALKNEGVNDISMGEFWLRSNTHRVTPDRRFYIKQPASAAHIYGKRFVAAEGLTSIGPHWEEDFAYMKPTLDRAYCEGLNHLVICTFSHSPEEAGKPGNEFFAGTHFNPNVTWWKQAPAFLIWSNRVSFMLSQGLFVGDVCYYYGDNVPNQVPLKHVNEDLGEGYDYDVCNTEVILDRMSVRDGKIRLPDGMSYYALVLPKHKGISPKAAKKTETMKKAGATVIDLKSGQNTRDALLKKGVIPDFTYKSRKPDALIDYIHRKTDSTDIYYVVNRNEQPEYLHVSFRVEGKTPELWRPETGSTGDYPVYQSADGRTILPLFLEPFGSVFVVFRKPQAASHCESISLNGENLFPELPRDTFDLQPFVFRKDVQPVFLLAGAYSLSSSDGKTQTFEAEMETVPVTAAWEVSFDTAWGGPEKVRFDKPVLWNEHPDAGIRYYSGTAEYVTSFRLTAEQYRNKCVYLDLGEVYHIAEVHINGQSA